MTHCSLPLPERLRLREEGPAGFPWAGPQPTYLDSGKLRALGATQRILTVRTPKL